MISYDGLLVGRVDGDLDFLCDGVVGREVVGYLDGDDVGIPVGRLVVGRTDGRLLGCTEGCLVGSRVGWLDGCLVG